jgi:MFS family permease
MEANSVKHETNNQRWLNRTVAGAGLTSALGDFCYETTTVILPGFLSVLGVPAAALGIIEGTADAVASFTKMVAGYIADKFGHRKVLVVVGYGLTPVGQALIALALGWPVILLGRIISWFGKGLRGPLRDAIMVQSITPENLSYNSIDAEHSVKHLTPSGKRAPAYREPTHQNGSSLRNATAEIV